MFGRLFHRKSTRSAQVTHTPAAALDIVAQLQDDLHVVRQRVQRLEIAYKELAEHHDTLEAQLGKLRGQVHGVRGGRPARAGGIDAIPLGDKERLREYVGLAAGRRYTHPEE